MTARLRYPLLTLLIVLLVGAGPLVEPVLASGTVSSSVQSIPVRTQQASDVPSDLPAGDEAADPLDAPVDEDTGATDESAESGPDPLDDGAATEVETTPVPVDTTPVTTTAAPVTTTTTAVSPLPEDFGRGQTVVLNPPAGVTVQPPTDCKYLLEHGRAVIGIGCGNDDGPWWLSQVGTVGVPVAQAPAGTQVTTAPVAAPGGSSAVVVVPGSASRLGDDAEVVRVRRATENGRTRLIFPDETSIADPDPSLAERRGRPRLPRNLRRGLAVFEGRQAAGSGDVNRDRTPATLRQRGGQPSLSAAQRTASAGQPKACRRLHDVRAAGGKGSAQAKQLHQRCRAAREGRR